MPSKTPARVAVQANARTIALKLEAERIAADERISYESALEKVAIAAGFAGAIDLRRALLGHRPS